MSYAAAEEYQLYLEGFVEEIYGDVGLNVLPSARTTDQQAARATFDADADRFQRRVDEVLKGVKGIDSVPLPKKDGRYPESVIELQAKMHICQRMGARKSLEWGVEIPDWFLQLKIDVRDLERNIMNGKFIFEDQTSETEYGVNAPTAEGDITGKAVFHTDNARHSSAYLGEDFIRNFIVEIKAVEDPLSIDGATFRFSTDEGKEWSEQNTSQWWVRLDDDGTAVRWAYPVGWNGSDPLFHVGDRWRFQCVPFNMVASPGRRDRRNPFVR